MIRTKIAFIITVLIIISNMAYAQETNIFTIITKPSHERAHTSIYHIFLDATNVPTACPDLSQLDNMPKNIQLSVYKEITINTNVPLQWYHSFKPLFTHPAQRKWSEEYKEYTTTTNNPVWLDYPDVEWQNGPTRPNPDKKILEKVNSWYGKFYYEDNEYTFKFKSEIVGSNVLTRKNIELWE
jgi:hypothetical protein